MQTLFAYTSVTCLCNHFSSYIFNCFSTTPLTMISCTQKETISGEKKHGSDYKILSFFVMAI